MSYEICKRCGKFFNKNGKSYCEDCIEKTEKEHDIIIDYVMKHPNSTILDIITETGVTLKSINNLVEEGYVSYDKLSKAMDKIVDNRSKFHIRRNLE